jgi:hypothetical protein
MRFRLSVVILDVASLLGRPAAVSESVKVLGIEGEAVVIEIGSGRYSFALRWPEEMAPSQPRPGSAKKRS